MPMRGLPDNLWAIWGTGEGWKVEMQAWPASFEATSSFSLPLLFLVQLLQSWLLDIWCTGGYSIGVSGTVLEHNG